MSERFPQSTVPRERALETLYAINGKLEQLNSELADIFAQMRGAMDILEHTEKTKGNTTEGRRRMQQLGRQVMDLKRQAMKIGETMDSLSQAGVHLTDTHTIEHNV